MKGLCAGVALALLVLAGCSADAPDPEATAGITAPDTAPPSTAARSFATPQSTTTDSVSTPSTEQEPASEPPEILAFSSSRDVGRLFEIEAPNGAVVLAEEPEGAATPVALSDGDVVQAIDVRSRSGMLWVRVESVGVAALADGWVIADSLRETTEIAIVDDSESSGEFLQIVARSGDVEVRSTAGDAGVVVDRRQPGEVVMHSGAVALTSTGDSMLEIVDPVSRVPVGWVGGSSVRTVRSVVALDESGAQPQRPADPPDANEAPVLGTVATGCNAVQVTLTAQPGFGGGSHVLYGTGTPTGTRSPDGSMIEWSSGADEGELIIDPGTSVTVTVPSRLPQTWFFLATGRDGTVPDAISTGEVSDTLVAGLEETVTTTSALLVDVALGTCIDDGSSGPAPTGSQ